jgi:DNA polymerase-3 subunit alpha
MISALKLANTKNPRPGSPSRYAMFDLEDMAGTMRCIAWPEEYQRFQELIVADAILAFKGSIDKRAGSDDANMIINEVLTLEQLPARYTRGIRIRVDERHGPKGVEQLYEILRGYPGPRELKLRIDLADGSRLDCDCEMRVEINNELRSRVEELLGAGSIGLLANGGGR